MKPLTKVEKMERRAKIIIGNEDKEKRNLRNQKIKDYIEYKMIRGYSRDEATHMATSLIDKQW
mgnify:FL=1|jgi:hypothetical protein|tara:strand:- start:1566 stop:1754 length:189 start_codon:yes stop_codon:yes gene_type:complete